MDEITLIIPAKNEAESLPRVLDELKNYSYNINVILHPSDESTIKAIKDYNIKIIYQKNYGYGDALIEGINNCNSKFFCIFNADGSFNPIEIDLMEKFMIKNKLDLVFASRYEKNSSSDDDTIITLIGNYIFTLMGKIFFKLKITDILYTFVLGNTENTKNLNLKEKDFCFCVELPIKARRKNLKIASLNSHERKRIAGKKKVNEIRDGFKILSSMIKLFFSKY
tara:strand:- start:5106 stop:5777 length:672 start_codon:yes stop_codon:yes gene_type:complete